MKKLRSTIYGILTLAGTVYTLVVIVLSIRSLLIAGPSDGLSSLFLIELMGVVLLLQAVAVVLSSHFERLWLYHLVLLVACWVTIIGCGMLFNWFSLSVENILAVTVIMVAIHILVTLFVYRKNKLDARRINEKLEGQRM